MGLLVVVVGGILGIGLVDSQNPVECKVSVLVTTWDALEVDGLLSAGDAECPTGTTATSHFLSKSYVTWRYSPKENKNHPSLS